MRIRHLATSSTSITSITSLTLMALVTAHGAEPATPKSAEPTTTPSAETKSSETTIIVSAQRAPETLAQTTSVVDVIDSEDRRERGHPAQVFEQLRGISGVETQSLYGGVDGGAARISLRGLRSSDTQVLLDGVPLNDPTAIASDANVSVLNDAALGRIEIAKGAQSGLYGSRAVGGVVNLITAAPTETPVNTVLIEGGSYGTARIDATATGPVTKTIGYTFGIVGLRSDGFSTQTDADAKGDPKKHEADALTRLGVNARVQAKLPGDGVLYVGVNAIGANQEYDGFAAPDDASANVHQRVGRVSAGGQGHVAERLTIAADVAATQTNRIGSSNDEGEYGYRGREGFASVRATADVLPANTTEPTWLQHAEFTVGIDRLNSRGKFDSFGDQYEHSSQLTGAWAQLRGGGECAELSAVVRVDHHDQFGNATTWRTAAAVFPMHSVKLLAAVGTAFRAPSLYELYAPTYGNADLQPQRSLTAEVGHESTLPADVTLRNVLFRTTYQTRIGYDPNTYQSINVDGPRVDGIESRLGWRDGEHGPRCAIVHTFVRDDQGGSAIVLLPHNHLTITPAWHWSKVWMGVTIDAIGHRHATPSDLGGYTLVHAVAGWTPRPWAELYVRAENLLDRAYSVNPGYSTAGRSAYGGAVLTF